MKKIIFGLLLVMCLVFVVGCTKKGIVADNVYTPSHENFEVTFLFEKDGVQIYRFQDGGRSRYFSIGNGSFQPQTVVQTNGKNGTQLWDDGAK